jgi:hypothetical protein
MLVLDSHVLGTPLTAIATAFAQLQSCAREEQEHRKGDRGHGHDDDDEDRSWVHTGNVPADRYDKRTTFMAGPR